jgi:glycosyltransferase involved in cell wall biosynthesis
MTELSIIIPARNEFLLQKTIDDLSENIRGDTEIIAVLDGYLPDPPLKSNPRLTIIYNPESKGQRAATNQGAKLAKGKYLMKVDAHCAFDKGFDVKMMADMQPDWTLIPQMKNLHAFDWICPDGHRRYQGPSGPCQWKFNGKEWVYSESKFNTDSDKVCGKPTKKDVVWIVKHNPTSETYRFDKTLHFQYWKDLSKRQTGDLIETLSIQGSCFMCTREKYFELDLCSEDFNSWGQQGVEVACKTWLSGGRLMVTKKTWYAHMFRTQGGDFGFPYHNPESKIQENRELSRKLFQYDTWPKATRKFQWLLDKFKPPEWDETKGAIFYTDNCLDEKIAKPVRDRLLKISQDKKINITSSSLKRMDFGVSNVHFPTMKRGYLALFKQILGALEKSTDNIVFFTEHDVLYHPSHFDFIPPDKETFYYNTNVWRVRLSDGHSLRTKDCKQLSGLCGYRDALVTHFRERFEMAEQKYKELVKSDGDLTEFNRWIRFCGFEPMTHNRIQWKNTFKCGSWESEVANLDLKHGINATGERWRKDQYRNQKWIEGWTEAENEIPGWGNIKPIIESMK